MAQDVFAYVDEAVAEIPVPDVSVQIGVHNTSTDAHSALFAGKAAVSHTHTAADVGATPAAHASDTTIHITAAERTTWNDKANSSHTHDDRYYTEIEINTLLTGKAATNHTHTAAQVGAATERQCNCRYSRARCERTDRGAQRGGRCAQHAVCRKSGGQPHAHSGRGGGQAVHMDAKRTRRRGSHGEICK